LGGSTVVTTAFWTRGAAFLAGPRALEAAFALGATFFFTAFPGAAFLTVFLTAFLAALLAGALRAGFFVLVLAAFVAAVRLPPLDFLPAIA